MVYNNYDTSTNLGSGGGNRSNNPVTPTKGGEYIFPALLV